MLALPLAIGTVVFYIILCAIIASSAAETNRSVLGYFILSLLLSPLTGFMVLSLGILANIYNQQHITATEEAPAPQAP